MSYATKQHILEESGMLHEEEMEAATGPANGSNRDFYVQHGPIVDRTYDEAVTAADVTAYVNGAVVPVQSVSPATRKITLVTAPASGADVTIDYAWSQLKDRYVEEVIEEVDEAIDTRLAAVSSVTLPFADDKIPATLRKIAKTYGAGLILTRDYGMNSDIENTSKDGDAKIKRAEKWLELYATLLDNNESDTTDADAPSSKSDGFLFGTYDEEEGLLDPDSDEAFMMIRD